MRRRADCAGRARPPSCRAMSGLPSGCASSGSRSATRTTRSSSIRIRRASRRRGNFWPRAGPPGSWVTATYSFRRAAGGRMSFRRRHSCRRATISSGRTATTIRSGRRPSNGSSSAATPRRISWWSTRASSTRLKSRRCARWCSGATAEALSTGYGRCRASRLTASCPSPARRSGARATHVARRTPMSSWDGLPIPRPYGTTPTADRARTARARRCSRTISSRKGLATSSCTPGGASSSRTPATVTGRVPAATRARVANARTATARTLILKAS